MQTVTSYVSAVSNDLMKEKPPEPEKELKRPERRKVPRRVGSPVFRTAK